MLPLEDINPFDNPSYLAVATTLSSQHVPTTSNSTADWQSELTTMRAQLSSQQDTIQQLLAKLDHLHTTDPLQSRLAPSPVRQHIPFPATVPRSAPTSRPAQHFPSHSSFQLPVDSDASDDEADPSELHLQQDVQRHAFNGLINQMQFPVSLPSGKFHGIAPLVEDPLLVAPTSDSLYRDAARAKLLALVHLEGRYPSIDDYLAAMVSINGTLCCDIRNLLVSYQLLGPLKYSGIKISSSLFAPGTNQSLISMADRDITRQAPMLTAEQMLAFLQEQLLKCFLGVPGFPCLFDPVEAMNKIIQFQQQVVALITRTFGGTSNATIQAHEHHVSTWAVIYMFVLTRWNRAMLTQDLSKLILNFDSEFNQHFGPKLGLNPQGTPVMPLRESLMLLLYSCLNCGRLGAVAETCTNPKCITLSSKQVSSSKASTSSADRTAAQHSANYKAALHTWRQAFPENTPKASKSDLLFRSTAAYHALSTADKTYTPSSATGTSTPKSTSTRAGVTHLIDNNQSRVILHLCPAFNLY